MKKTALYAVILLFSYASQAKSLVDLFETNKHSVVTIYVAESLSPGTGAPMGLPFSLSRGVISGRHSEKNLFENGEMLKFFQTDASINTGNSVQSALTHKIKMLRAGELMEPGWVSGDFQPTRK